MLHIDKLDQIQALFMTARGRKTAQEVETMMVAIKARLLESPVRRLLFDISLTEHTGSVDDIVKKYIEIGHSLPPFEIALIHNEHQRHSATLIKVGFHKSGHKCERFDVFADAYFWLDDCQPAKSEI